MDYNSYNNRKNEADEWMNWLAPTEEDEELASRSNIVDGIGFDDVENTDDSDAQVDDILKDLNSQNQASYEEEMRRMREETEAHEAEEARLREEERARYLAKVAEEEAKERARIQKEEEEEERRLAEEAEAKRKANPLYKLKDKTSEIAAKNAEKFRENRAKAAEEKERKAQELALKKEEEAKNIQNTQKVPASKKENKKISYTPKEEPASQKKEKKSTGKKPDFEFLATHDQLTGIKNATAYELATSQIESTEGLVLIFFDINDLKLTNDSKGHAAGDILITTIAKAIEEQFPQNTYRIGGDEFVVLFSAKKNAQKLVEDKLSSLRAKLVSLSRNDKEHIVYSVAIGYAVGEKDQDFQELRKIADKNMYGNKQEIKGAKKKGKKEKKPVDHDSTLTEEQRNMKHQVRQGHSITSEDKTEKIIREIQTEYANIYAVLIADKDFDHLFVIQNIDYIINMAIEMDYLLDYSYIYVVYEKGTRFFGVDEYSDDISSLFENIGNQVREMLIRRGSISDKELQKIKNINIFKQLYIG